MPSRFAFSLVAAAAAMAVRLAVAAEPGTGVVVAQLGPTSPGFKMTMNRGETGAPEPTPAGVPPVAGQAQWRGKGAHASTGKDAADKPATTKDEAKAADDGKAARPAAAEHARPARSAPSAPLGTMDFLRERLAAKLGARPAADGKFAMQVSTRGETGENVITATRPVAAHRAHKPAARASAVAGAANMDIAANAGRSLLPTHWDYEGAGGPDSWGRLRPEYDKCATGQRQSPIDIRGGIAVDLEPIQFDYHPSGFSVVDNGHTVQVDVEPGNSITITGRRYELVQFHFHRPSEERIDGRQHDMVAHLVHRDADGRLAVVAVLLDRGAAQSVVQAVWNNLPLEKGEAVHADSRIDLAQLLPEDRRYYTYMGSLTTPPCSEGVLWMVLKQPVPVSPEQEAIFAHLYPMNARPIQQADGRLIKESN